MRERFGLLAVLVLTLAGLGLRLAGVNAVLPHANEPDAALVAQSEILRGERDARYDEEQNYHAWAKYPHAISLAMAVVPRPGSPDEIDEETVLARHLAFAGRHFRAARIAVALLSVLVIPLTWLFARRFLGPGHSLLASAFAATSLMLTNYGQQARPHAPLATFALLAVYAACLLAERGSLARYAFAGVGAALAVGTLHSGAFVLPALLAAHLLAVRGRPVSESRWRAHAKALIPLALLALSLWPFYPFIFDGVTEWGGSLSKHADFPHRVEGGWFNGRGFPKLWSFLWDEDPVMFALALTGLALGAARLLHLRGRGASSLTVTLAALVPCVLVLGLYENTFNRFIVPLAPFAAVLAAYASSRIGAGRRGLGVALVALVFPALLSVRLAVIRARPDTYTLAARWIEAQVERETQKVLVTPTLPVPLFRVPRHESDDNPGESSVKLRWYYYQWTMPKAELEPQWNIAPLTSTGRLPEKNEDYPVSREAWRAILERVAGDYCLVLGGTLRRENMRAEIAALGVELSRISPWKSANGPPGGMGYQGHRFFRDVLAAERMGPVIWVYSLR